MTPEEELQLLRKRRRVLEHRVDVAYAEFHKCGDKEGYYALVLPACQEMVTIDTAIARLTYQEYES